MNAKNLNRWSVLVAILTAVFVQPTARGQGFAPPAAEPGGVAANDPVSPPVAGETGAPTAAPGAQPSDPESGTNSDAGLSGRVGSGGGPGAPSYDAANLAQHMATAMAKNPDILVAEAKVRGAQAELDRARLAVARELIDTLQSIRRQEKVIEIARQQLASSKENRGRVEELVKAGNISSTEMAAADIAVRDADLGVVKAEADMQTMRASFDYLLGHSQGTGSFGIRSYGSGAGGAPMGFGSSGAGFGVLFGDGSIGPAAGPTAPSGVPAKETPTGDEGATRNSETGGGSPKAGRGRARNVVGDLRRAMDEPTTVAFTESTLNEAMKYFDDLHGLRNVVIDRSSQSDRDFAEETVVSLRLDGVSLGAALIAIEDHTDARFFIMEYGLRVAEKDKKIENGMTLREFLATAAN